MASFVYTLAAVEILRGTINLHTGGNDIRVALLKTASLTTADTELDVATVGAFTTLGEIVTTNYTTGGMALTNEIVNSDLPNDRGEFDADDAVFTALGTVTTDTIGAALIYKFVTSFALSIPIAYLDFVADTATNGGNITVTFNAEGIVQSTCPQTP